MQISLLALSLALGSAIQAAPTEDTPAVVRTPHPICGPQSNCELVERDGARWVQFKRGEEPGTANYAKRMAGKSKRDDERNTKVFTSDTKVDCGCEESVTPNFDGLWELCPEDGPVCDEEAETTREILWTGGKNPQSDTEIKLTAEGTYPDKEARDHLIHAIKATVSDDTIDQTDRRWTGTSGSHWGPNHGTCKMNRFAKFVGVAVFDSDDDLKSSMKATIHMEEDGSGACETMAKAGSAITGAISGIGGGFFGALEMACGSINE